MMVRLQPGVGVMIFVGINLLSLKWKAMSWEAKLN